MTIDAIIEGILDREGGYCVDPHTKQPTNWGIQADEWGQFCGMSRDATAAEMRAVTREKAAAYYRQQWVEQSPFLFVAYEPLRVQMIDFAVNSGTERAIRWLQRALGFDPTFVSGAMDDRTKRALQTYPGPLVNKAVVAARACMMQRTAMQRPENQGDELGWYRRALTFVDIPATS